MLKEKMGVSSERSWRMSIDKLYDSSIFTESKKEDSTKYTESVSRLSRNHSADPDLLSRKSMSSLEASRNSIATLSNNSRMR